MIYLLNAATEAATGAAVPMFGATRTVQSSVTGTGAVTATVLIEVSNDGANFELADTHTLSGTTSDSAGNAYSGNWTYMRARLTAISGTGAAVTVTAGN